MTREFFLVVIALGVLPAGALAQTDAEKLAEARAALKHDDCATARRLFESVSQRARQSATWLDDVARAAECSGDQAAALRYYEAERNLLGPSERLSQKIGELRYLVNKANRENDARRMQEEARLRSEQERRRQEDQRTAEISAFRKRLEPLFTQIEREWSKLPKNLPPDKYTVESTQDPSYRVVDGMGCQLQVTQTTDKVNRKREHEHRWASGRFDLGGMDHLLEVKHTDELNFCFSSDRRKVAFRYSLDNGQVLSGTDEDFVCIYVTNWKLSSLFKSLQNACKR